MTAPRIPRIPQSRRAQRFGTDPDSRPPMKTGDAILAVVCMACSALVVISLVSGGLALLAHLKPEAKEAIAQEEANRASSGAIERAAK